ncbi:unnamed protein product, partial [Rotaria magnacalcarata]
QMRQTDDEQERQRYQVAQNDYLRAEQEKAEKKARDRSNLSQYHIAQMERKRMQHMNEKQKDLQEGEEYRRLGEQYAHEQMEIERFRKLTQHDVKNMYDQALDDKFKVRQMEKQLDE